MSSVLSSLKIKNKLVMKIIAQSTAMYYPAKSSFEEKNLLIKPTLIFVIYHLPTAVFDSVCINVWKIFSYEP